MSKASREYVLQVGETAIIKRSFLGASYAVIYAGMPGETIYSVVITTASGYHALAYNLFLSVNNKKIRLPRGSLSVSHLSTAEIRFRIDGW
jgi:hypothetical protein